MKKSVIFTALFFIISFILIAVYFFCGVGKRSGHSGDSDLSEESSIVSFIGTLDKIYMPFASLKDRTDFDEMKPRFLDGFGAYRIAGHKHAGLDMEGDYNEPVYAIGRGIVKAVYGAFPYATVLIFHFLPDNERVYSVYIHIEDICVAVNQTVDCNTKLGRLFSEEQFLESGFYRNHLHFEIRKTFEKYRGLSIKCFSMEELYRYFYDPLFFLKEKMKYVYGFTV